MIYFLKEKKNITRLNWHLFSSPRDIVITSSWLNEKAISYQRRYYYSCRDDSILKNIRIGAYVVKKHQSLQIYRIFFILKGLK